MRIRRLFLAGMLAAALLTGCGGGTSDSDGGGEAKTVKTTDLSGEFVAESVEGFTLPEGADLRMTFEPGSFSAGVGCNSMGGKFKLSDGDFVASSVFSTEMACADELMDAEAWVQDFLAKPVEVEADGENLVLSDGKATLTLKPVEEQNPEIEGTVWELNSIGDAAAVSSIPAGVRPPTVRFSDGRVRISGCNGGGGEAELLDDGLIDFGPVKLTRRSCGKESDRVEKQVLETLRGEVASGFEGQSLTLSRGGRSLTFIAKESP